MRSNDRDGIVCVMSNASAPATPARQEAGTSIRSTVPAGCGSEPIVSPSRRRFVKNKSLFPLMKEKEVVLITLLEGEMIRGIIEGFTRYDITINVKGGRPVTVLRHCLYDMRDKRGRCYLKSVQEERRDWEKSPLYVSD